MSRRFSVVARKLFRHPIFSRFKRSKLFRRQLLAAVGIVAVAAGLSVYIVSSSHAAGISVAEAPKSLSECKSAKSQFRCYGAYYAAKTWYEGEVPAFAALKADYESDAYVKAECHQITHVIGRTGYIKYGGLDGAYAKGDSFCWSGYHHGAIEEAIDAVGNDRITTDAPKICKSFADKRAYSFDHFNCVHGLGHGLMAVGAYDVPKSLELCDVMPNDWERQSCYGGVYMENVMLVSRSAGATKGFFKDDEPLYPCTFVKQAYKEQCYLMQTSYVLQKNGYNFGQTFAECAKADEGFIETCYRSIGRDASGSTVSDKDRTIANCRMATDETGLHNCMLGAVRDFVSYYHDDKKALELCEGFGGGITEPCRQDVANYYKAF